MRSVDEVAAVRRLLAAGLNDRQIARSSGIPRGTVRNWRQRLGSGWQPEVQRGCPTCGHPVHDPAALPPRQYTYLLGLYLGDGYIVRQRKGVFWLRVFLDERYPGIIDECAAAVEAVISRPPARIQCEGCIAVSSHSKSWPCLFPQHGPGRKHERPIVLAEWQQEIVDRHPEALLRGLIHSDGWRGLNRVTVKGKQYVYPRYQFCNASGDIRRMFCEACDQVGVRWRPMTEHVISVARREAVARLDEFVGPKR